MGGCLHNSHIEVYARFGLHFVSSNIQPKGPERAVVAGDRVPKPTLLRCENRLESSHNRPASKQVADINPLGFMAVSSKNCVLATAAKVVAIDKKPQVLEA